jgi:hypothetical protein
MKRHSKDLQMTNQYTASVYSGQEKIAEQTGDNVEKLYAWMLLQGHEQFGEVHGDIIDNTSKEVIRTFRKAAIE